MDRRLTSLLLEHVPRSPRFYKATTSSWEEVRFLVLNKKKEPTIDDEQRQKQEVLVIGSTNQRLSSFGRRRAELPPSAIVTMKRRTRDKRSNNATNARPLPFFLSFGGRKRSEVLVFPQNEDLANVLSSSWSKDGGGKPNLLTTYAHQTT